MEVKVSVTEVEGVVHKEEAQRRCAVHGLGGVTAHDIALHGIAMYELGEITLYGIVSYEVTWCGGKLAAEGLWCVRVVCTG